MESMAASQSANVVIVFQCVNANSTCITRVLEALGWQSAINVVILIVGLLTRDSLKSVVVCCLFG
jgi:hypothetical protein